MFPPFLSGNIGCFRIRTLLFRDKKIELFQHKDFNLLGLGKLLISQNIISKLDKR